MLAPVREACRRFPHPLRDERVGEVRPGDADAEVLQRCLGAREARRHRLHHPFAAVDVARHRAGGVVGRRQRPAAVDRNSAERHLEAGDAAAGGGDPDRPAGVAAQGGVDQPRGQGGTAASARPAGHAARCGRVGHPAVVVVLGGDPPRELVQVGLADHHVAGVLEQRHRRRGLVRHVVAEDRRPVRGPQAGGVEEVLDGESRAVPRGLDLRDEDAHAASCTGCSSARSSASDRNALAAGGWRRPVRHTSAIGHVTGSGRNGRRTIGGPSARRSSAGAPRRRGPWRRARAPRSSRCTRTRCAGRCRAGRSSTRSADGAPSCRGRRSGPRRSGPPRAVRLRRRTDGPAPRSPRTPPPRAACRRTRSRSCRGRPRRTRSPARRHAASRASRPACPPPCGSRRPGTARGTRRARRRGRTGRTDRCRRSAPRRA